MRLTQIIKRVLAPSSVVTPPALVSQYIRTISCAHVTMCWNVCAGGKHQAPDAAASLLEPGGARDLLGAAGGASERLGMCWEPAGSSWELWEAHVTFLEPPEARVSLLGTAGRQLAAGGERGPLGADRGAYEHPGSCWELLGAAGGEREPARVSILELLGNG